MAENSPKWTKPSDVMRIRKRRKAVPKPRAAQSAVTVTRETQSPSRTASPKPSASVKRRNPFGCSPRKKAHVSGLAGVGRCGENTQPVDAGAGLLDVLSDADSQQRLPIADTMSVSMDVLKEKMSLNQESTTCMSPREKPVINTKDISNISTKEESPTIQGSEDFPMDWSLKTKVRYISNKPFNWSTNLKSTDEALGISKFVQGADTQVKDRIQNVNSNTDAKQDFCRHCHVWIHPNFPWMRMFPRILDDNKIGKPSIFMENEQLQNAAVTDWTSSFTSIFHTVRSGMCPYFYLCTHQFTVLFRAAGMGGISELHAILTPTSRGFRESLRKEDIEFTMPLVKRTSTDGKQNISQQPENTDTETSNLEKDEEENTEKQDLEEEEEDISQTDEGASSWLQSIGLDSARFRSLDPNKVKIQREGYQAIDHRAESMCLVRGADTQALFNYLLNCRSCFAPTGPQAGVPPTILSPVAFHGAMLKALKAKTGVVRQAGDVPSYSLEITGPLLPSTLSGLATLFSHTQHSFTSVYSVHEPSTPFNAVLAEDQGTSEQEEEVSDMLAKSGVPLGHLKKASKANNFGKQAIRELNYEKDGFIWMC